MQSRLTRVHGVSVRVRLFRSAALGGVVTGFAVVRDFDSGFAHRLMLSAPRRSGTIAGYTVGALLRWALTGPSSPSPLSSPVYMPLILLTGWIHDVTNLNPVTPVPTPDVVCWRGRRSNPSGEGGRAT